MKLKNKYNGKIVFVRYNEVFIAQNKNLYFSKDSGITWEKIFTIKTKNLKELIINRFHLLSRLFRYGFHHVAIGRLDYGIIYNKKKALISKNKLIEEAHLGSSRPFSLEYMSNSYIYGEYRSNPERSVISINSFKRQSIDKKLYSFNNIRHIHGVYQDPYTDSIWITTGDKDHESAIFQTKNYFKTIEKVVGDSQQTRAIKLLFTKNYLYFGSDAPHEINHLYRINRDDNSVNQLQQVGSSVFHGCKVDNWLFFSTAIEPSSVNSSKYAEVWASPNGTEWKCIYIFKKDLFSMKYFQYGQIYFPNGTGDNKNLWLSPFATKKSNKTYKIDLNQVKSRYKQC